MRTQRDFTARIRIKFLAAIHAAMGDTECGIVGGAALAEYGNLRDTSDVDIITPQDVSLVVEGQLLSRGMVRTARGCLGYIAASCLDFHPSTLLRYILKDAISPRAALCSLLDYQRCQFKPCLNQPILL